MTPKELAVIASLLFRNGVDVLGDYLRLVITYEPDRVKALLLSRAQEIQDDHDASDAQTVAKKELLLQEQQDIINLEKKV